MRLLLVCVDQLPAQLVSLILSHCSSPMLFSSSCKEWFYNCFSIFYENTINLIIYREQNVGFILWNAGNPTSRCQCLSKNSCCVLTWQEAAGWRRTHPVYTKNLDLTHENEALMNRAAGKAQASSTTTATIRLASQGFIQPLAGDNNSIAVTTLKQQVCSSSDFGQGMMKHQRACLQASWSHLICTTTASASRLGGLCLWVYIWTGDIPVWLELGLLLFIKLW